MVKISMNTFIKFVSSSGMHKVEIVDQAKQRYDAAYDPKKDFYKRLRDEIKLVERKSLPMDTFDRFLDIQSKRKFNNYSERITAYRDWRKKFNVSFFPPNTGIWEHDDLTINVAPELGLIIDDTPNLIKLYFEKRPIAAARIDVVLQLMNLSNRKKAPKNCVMAILDVKNKVLHQSTKVNNRMQVLLRGEAANFSSMWKDL